MNQETHHGVIYSAVIGLGYFALVLKNLRRQQDVREPSGRAGGLAKTFGENRQGFGSNNTIRSSVFVYFC
jgi:hypothetical protein